MDSSTTRTKGGRLYEHLKKTEIPVQNNPLLRLPAEIRNKIMEYSLSSESALGFVHGKPNQRSVFVATIDLLQASRPAKEFNVIKRVCRQLFEETATLEFQINTLNFDKCLGMTEALDMSASESASWFLGNCSTNTVSPKRFVLHLDLDSIDPSESEYENTRDILSLAARNPNIQFDIMIDPFDLTDDDDVDKKGRQLWIGIMSIALSRNPTGSTGITSHPLCRQLIEQGQVDSNMQLGSNVMFRLPLDVHISDAVDAICEATDDLDSLLFPGLSRAIVLDFIFDFKRGGL